MLDGSFDIAPAIRDLAIELDVPRRRVRLLEDAVAALQAADVKPAGSTETSASSTRLSSPKSVGSGVAPLSSNQELIRVAQSAALLGVGVPAAKIERRWGIVLRSIAPDLADRQD